MLDTLKVTASGGAEKAKRSATRLLRKVLGRPYVAVNTWIWRRLASRFASRRIVQAYGNHLHCLNQLRSTRTQSVGTFFFRNRPQLELMRRLIHQWPRGSTVTIAILGCSKGAEVYSISHIIRRSRRDLRFHIKALDISPGILEFARAGAYDLGSPYAPPNGTRGRLEAPDDVSSNTSRDQPSSMFERVSPRELEEMFVRDHECVKIRSELRRDISWHLGDAGDPNLVNALGIQDIVAANDFLCHMRPRDAEGCLRNIARLVTPGGYLFVSGVDLDVRGKVARDLGWIPITEAISEIHEGDPSLRRGWPLEYWGLEPFNRGRNDWATRYATVFRSVRNLHCDDMAWRHAPAAKHANAG